MSGTLLQNGMYFGSMKLEIQAIGDVSITRYGLGEADVYWRCPTAYVYKLSPALRIPHPVFGWMTLEKLDFKLDVAYSDIIGHFAGAYPGGDPTYDYQPSFSEFPITRFAKGGRTFADLVTAAGSGPQQSTFNPDNGQFIGFGILSDNNMAGITSYLLAQGLYVKSSVDVNPPDTSQDGSIQSPDGNPPGGNANWLRCPTVFQQRASVYDIRESWKGSGSTPFPSAVYSS